MYIFMIVVHIVVCLVLISVILLQAGRGSGLGGFMGGGAAQTFLGTRAGDFFTKATTTCAILFLLTCLSLGVITSRRSRSLLEGNIPVQMETSFPELDLTVEESSSADVDAAEEAVPSEPIFPDVE